MSHCENTPDQLDLLTGEALIAVAMRLSPSIDDIDKQFSVSWPKAMQSGLEEINDASAEVPDLQAVDLIKEGANQDVVDVVARLRVDIEGVRSMCVALEKRFEASTAEISQTFTALYELADITMLAVGK